MPKRADGQRKNGRNQSKRARRPWPDRHANRAPATRRSNARYDRQRSFRHWSVHGQASHRGWQRTCTPYVALNARCASSTIGQSDAYIDTFVNEATKAGTITISQGLATANGTVDTAVLLYSLIEKARAAAGEPSLPPTVANTDVALTSDQDADQRFYTVWTVDSLGAIAVKFYGSVAKYDLIYQGNRKVLSSPNAIQVGQRLTIP